MKTLTLEEAQRSLPSLAKRALRGEQVLIQVDGAELVSLQSVPAELPQNYLDDCYGPDEIAQENYLASKAPRSTAT